MAASSEATADHVRLSDLQIEWLAVVAKLQSALKQAEVLMTGRNPSRCLALALRVRSVRCGHLLRLDGLAHCAGNFFERAKQPLLELVQRNNLTKGDIAAVELLGGGSRVPRVKAALSEALDGRGLDK